MASAWAMQGVASCAHLVRGFIRVVLSLDWPHLCCRHLWVISPLPLHFHAFPFSNAFDTLLMLAYVLTHAQIHLHNLFDCRCFVLFSIAFNIYLFNHYLCCPSPSLCCSPGCELTISLWQSFSIVWELIWPQTGFQMQVRIKYHQALNQIVLALLCLRLVHNSDMSCHGWLWDAVSENSKAMSRICQQHMI